MGEPCLVLIAGVKNNLKHNKERVQSGCQATLLLAPFRLTFIVILFYPHLLTFSPSGPPLIHLRFNDDFFVCELGGSGQAKPQALKLKRQILAPKHLTL